MGPMRDLAFQVSPPRRDGAAWGFVVEGVEARRYGPFPSVEEADRARWMLLQRWRQRARRLGGHAWVRVADEWVVTLPRDVPCAGRPLVTDACTRHQA